MASGLFGYMGYDMVGLVERLPDTKPDMLGIPDGLFLRPTVIAIFDNIADTHHRRDAGLARAPTLPPRAAYDRARERLADVVADLERSLPHRREAAEAAQELPAPAGQHDRASNAWRMVEKAKDYIRAGDIFQVVPSHALCACRSGCRPSRSTARCAGSTPRRSCSSSISAASRGRLEPGNPGAPARRQGHHPPDRRHAAARRDASRRTARSPRSCSPTPRSAPSI